VGIVNIKKTYPVKDTRGWLGISVPSLSLTNSLTEGKHGDDVRFCLAIIFVVFGVCLMIAPVHGYPDWIQVNGTETRFITDCGNVIVYNNGSGYSHITDFYHNGLSYGGLANADHKGRGYTLYEAYYILSDGSTASCHQSTANIKKIVYADDSVAVVVSGCSAKTHEETWRYVIPRAQCGFYETEQKTIKTNLEAQNDQLVQFLNTSLLNLYFSDRSGKITKSSGYAPLFTQFSKPGMPFTWEGGVDPLNNVSLALIHLGSDNLARTAHRRYIVVNSEQQVDVAGAGEATRTEMPLGTTWFESWKGIVFGDSSAIREKALSLVGNTTDEAIHPFISVSVYSGAIIANTGTLVYQQRPFYNYDVPYGSGNLQMITEYPAVNGIPAYTGADLTSTQDAWNSTYRNTDMSFAQLNYSIDNRSYWIQNKRTAYRDADGIEWTFGITPKKTGNTTVTITYTYPPAYTTGVTNTTFSVKTNDPIEGEYGLTLIFPEDIRVTSTSSRSVVSFEPHFQNAGERVNYTIYAIPHKWSTPASKDTFHTREKTSLKIPYRVLLPGLEWMPSDSVTAYDAQKNASGYTISVYADAGVQKIQMYSTARIESITTTTGMINYTQTADGTILADWVVPSATIGKIFLGLQPEKQLPIIGITSNVTEGYPPLAVEFVGNSTGSPLSWQWDVDNDGIYDYSGQNITHTYHEIIGTKIKSFSVKLNVTDVEGSNITIKTGYITEYPLQAAFNANVTEGTIPFDVGFSDMTKNGTPSVWNWSFGDGSFSDQQHPVHNYTLPGCYEVTLNASNEYSYNTSEKTALIMAYERRIANFTTNVTTGSFPLTVQFNDTSRDNPKSWFWQFGDGNSSIDQNPTYTYLAPGSYSVNLSIVTDSGNYSIVRAGIIVVKNIPPPHAEFSSNTTSGKSPLSIAFTDKSSGVVTLWNWSFGDGSFSGDQNPVHTYSSTTAMSYTVSLVVSNPGGKNSSTKIKYISLTSGLPLKANFTSDVSSGFSPLRVAFTDQSEGNPTGWNWSFGDGCFSGDQNPVHSYISTIKRNYTVALTVSGSSGNSRLSKVNLIGILPAPLPIPDFTANPTSGKSPLTVTFTDLSTGNVTAWNWSFGEATFSEEKNPVHTYTSSVPRKYMVYLTVTNEYGSNRTTKFNFTQIIP
jgi:PKD repeat protein